MDTGQFTLNLTVTPGSNFSLQLSGGRSFNSGVDRQTSYSFSAVLNATIAQRLSLNPSFNYLRTETNGEITDNYSLFFNYYLTLIPKVFALSGSSSYSSTKTPDGVLDRQSFSLSSRLSFLLEWLWSGFGQSSIFIEGQLLRDKLPIETYTNWKLFASAVISF